MNQEEKKAPIWTWLFVILCSSIPIVALGGLIPYVLGGMGEELKAIIDQGDQAGWSQE